MAEEDIHQSRRGQAGSKLRILRRMKGTSAGAGVENREKLGNLFGSGMHHGGMCGVLTAATMILGLAGFEKDASTAMIREFKQKHDSTQCRDLLAASASKGIVRKTHCDGLVFEMTKYLDDILSSRS